MKHFSLERYDLVLFFLEELIFQGERDVRYDKTNTN